MEGLFVVENRGFRTDNSFLLRNLSFSHDLYFSTKMTKPVQNLGDSVILLGKNTRRARRRIVLTIFGCVRDPCCIVNMFRTPITPFRVPEATLFKGRQIEKNQKARRWWLCAVTGIWCSPCSGQKHYFSDSSGPFYTLGSNGLIMVLVL